MKKTIPSIALRFIVVAATLLTGYSASASVLLTIDVTNPSAVVFSSTLANASINDNTSTQIDGVSLLEIFTSSYTITFPQSLAISTLTPTGLTNNYDLVVNNRGTVNNRSLIFFKAVFDSQAFTTSASAFTGSLTYDLSGASLASMGSTGNIIAGDGSGATGTVIGQWQVVPEPSAASLWIVSGMGAWLMIRKRKN